MSYDARKRVLGGLLAVYLASLVIAGGCSEEPTASSTQNVLAEFEIREEAEVILLPVTFEQEQYLFMLDTGTTVTSFDDSLRHRLGQPTRSGKAMTGAGPMVVEAFEAPAALLGPLKIEDANEVATTSVGQVACGFESVEVVEQFGFGARTVAGDDAG